MYVKLAVTAGVSIQLQYLETLLQALWQSVLGENVLHAFGKAALKLRM
jgi:hypothetical protein